MPPVTIVPTNTTDTMESTPRKKTNSVSFSLDSSTETDTGQPQSTSSSLEGKEDVEKAESRKNKVSIIEIIQNFLGK